MKLIILCFVLISLTLASTDEEKLDKLVKLQKLYSLGILNDDEFKRRKDDLVDDYLETKSRFTAPEYKYYQKVVDKNNQYTVASNWTMPLYFTPQTEWLMSIFENSMPKSYLDVLPYNGGISYWSTKNYLSSGAFDFNGTRLPLDDMVAIQERALTHVGLNLYDAGIWSVALALSGFESITGMYYRNVMYTSGTGANPQIGGLKSIRAWEPNPDPTHPPDPFYYGRTKVKNTDLPAITMPGNLSYIKFTDGCGCMQSGCCAQEGVKQIPGNFFYRMIGPGYTMWDPMNGYYGYTWRAVPYGPNPDPAQYFNFAGVIHWNDWKPITGENVWGAILGPLQVMLVKNCTNIPKFSTFDNAPYEVQLAISILPAAQALLSPLGSMYHCPLGTKMYPPDPDEATNVSNENNFSSWAAFKALAFVLDYFYTGGDQSLDAAKATVALLLKGLDAWFANNLLPNTIAGELVISQGGHVSFAGVYTPQGGDQAFAVDCQTWGLLVVGQRRFDAAYASKGVTAYSVWQSAKKLAGYYINGQLAGVGYTTTAGIQPDIWSGEWTWGAIFMCRKVATEYAIAGRPDYAASMRADADSMEGYLKQQVKTCDDDPVWCPGGGLMLPDGSYLYANKRFFIPWGWYANPIGATSSTAWGVCDDFNYNPFMLGGGTNTTFWQEQCKNNAPTSGILQALIQYYDY